MSFWQIFFLKREPRLTARNKTGNWYRQAEGLCESLETAEGHCSGLGRRTAGGSGEAMHCEFGLVSIHEGIPTHPPSS